MRNLDAIKASLEAQLAELKVRQTHVAEALAQPLDPDSSEQAVEKEDDISLEAEAMLIAREIGSISRALQRIEHGTYGECISCGADIDPRRLEVRPEAALCLSCAASEQK